MSASPARSSPSCSLAALGQISAIGSTCDEVLSRLVAGDTSCLSARDDLVPERSLIVGAVRDPLPEIPAHLARYACRNNQLALAALRSIGAEVDGALRRFGRTRVGVVVGSSNSGAASAEAALVEKLRTGALAPGFCYEQLEFGGLAGFLSQVIGAAGPAYTVSTACSSGARALASARSLLRLGLCDAVIAGAADSLCGLTTNGFTALGAIAQGICNPFSRNRQGLTLGEGAALFLVTADPDGIQLVGIGESSEAHHISAPDPDGRGFEAAMRGALADASLAPEQISYLNLHGTGTLQNDAVEGNAVHRIFGADVPCSSTKPLIGHALGAAGALEAAFCWLVLRARADSEIRLPPHVFDAQFDPTLPAIRLVARGERARAVGRGFVMTNSFGFGGNDCTLVLAGPAA